MIDIAKLRALGEPWTIYVPLTADADLVVPALPKRIPNAVSSSGKYLLGSRVIILGFAYDFVAASGNGFDLEHTWYSSPASTRQIFGARASANDLRVSLSVPETFIPLDGGSSSPDSPGKLVLNVTATPPTSGRLLIWGVVTDGQEPLLGNKYFGSPYAPN